MTRLAVAGKDQFLRWLHNIVYLLEFEPTWFGEFSCGVGLILWATGAFLTDDVDVQGWAWLLPGLAAMLGLVRCVVLVRLWYEARVVLAALSAVLITYLICALAARFGWVPMIGWLAAAWISEMLTASKFSIPCLRELMAEHGVDAE